MVLLKTKKTNKKTKQNKKKTQKKKHLTAISAPINVLTERGVATKG